MPITLEDRESGGENLPDLHFSPDEDSEDGDLVRCLSGSLALRLSGSLALWLSGSLDEDSEDGDLAQALRPARPRPSSQVQVAGNGGISTSPPFGVSAHRPRPQCLATVKKKNYLYFSLATLTWTNLANKSVHRPMTEALKCMAKDLGWDLAPPTRVVLNLMFMHILHAIAA
jgi:hypothetical protein